MVSNASEDLPEPETPVMTVSLLCGIESVRFLRLWRRAPRTTISPRLVCTFKRLDGERPNEAGNLYFSNRHQLAGVGEMKMRPPVALPATLRVGDRLLMLRRLQS